MEFRPCIDLHVGKVKQIVGSTLKSDTVGGDSSSTVQTNFESDKDAAYYAELYKKDGLKGGHVILLGGGHETESEAKKALNAYPGGLQVGGGINLTNALKYLEEGASHVIVTSFIFKDGKLELDNLQELFALVGKKRLVIDLSARRKSSDSPYFVVTDKWQKFTDFELNEENLKFLGNFCDEFLVHGVEVEGKRCGVLEDLIELLKLSPIPVTYAGGVRSIEDVKLVKQIGSDKVNISIGSALDLFGGDLSYEEVVQYFKSPQQPTM